MKLLKNLRPHGAYVAASHSIAIIFNIKLIDCIGFGLYFLLFIFWLGTLINTALHTYHGTVFK